MNDFIEQQVLPALSQITISDLGSDLISLDAVSNIQWQDGKLSLDLTLGYPGLDIQQQVSQLLWDNLQQLPGVEAVDVDSGWQSPASVTASGKQPLPDVRNVIAVASCKGGVGKSTTTVNLALALAQLGARVGILDADIYGPSQAIMLGIGQQRPQIAERDMMLPLEAHGVQSMSMGYLVTEKTPMVWRGPMVTGALQQLLFKTQWQALDYLLIDMPPGTGDIQLTLSQQVPVSGAVIVTTPQEIALLEAKKGIEMFAKVQVPILGVVENMAMHICSQCGHQEPIFGSGGGEAVASDYDTTLLGSLPLDLSIRKFADSGKPSVVAEPDSDIATCYKLIAQKMAARLWLMDLQAEDMPEIVVTED